jgi:hypothetical protein
VASKAVPDAREEVDLGGLRADWVANFFLFLVAICHQTSPRGKQPVEGDVSGRHFVGWDYLVARFKQRSLIDPSWLMPQRWRDCQPSDVVALFADPQFGTRFTAVDRRAEMLRDLGNRITEHGWTNADSLFHACRGRIRTGSPNLIDTLSKFDAYRDPVWKKSLFFLALMQSCSNWRYLDPENLGPPVDYHEMRGHLRLRTVRVVDSALLSKLRSGSLINETEEVAIRRSVFKAIMLISELSGVRDPSRLHYLFWNLFRGVCVRMQPRCRADDFPQTLPTRYWGQLTVDAAVHCPYEQICPSANTPDPILEPVADTDYY